MGNCWVCVNIPEGSQFQRIDVRRALILLSMPIFVIWFAVCHPVSAQAANSQSSFLGVDAFNEMAESMEAFFADSQASIIKQWDHRVAEEERRWQRLEREVLHKWDIYRQSTNKIWVDYDDDREAVSQVDFETGEVVVEILVPAEATPEEQRTALADKLDRLQKHEDADGRPVMEELLPPNVAGEVATGTVQPSDPVPIIGDDGVERLKVGVRLTMVPDHIARQAIKFLPAVEAAAEVNGLEQALVLAIIHTESAFNPMARSPVPAYGLMQIVPRHAGREAYRHLYDDDRIPTAEYLYMPNNNILIGTTYLHRLYTIYFNDVTDADTRRFIVVCAYNWGPTAMRDRVLSRIDYNALSAEVIRQHLLTRVPEETRNYLIRVEERRMLYSNAL